MLVLDGLGFLLVFVFLVVPDGVLWWFLGGFEWFLVLVVGGSRYFWWWFWIILCGNLWF